MFQLTFYVPEKFSEKVKKAVFQAGAGALGHYDQCSFETMGRGQFRPLKGSSPFLGKKGKLQYVPEIRVEMICKNRYLKKSIKALLEAHPYETPAYYITKMVRI